MTCFEITTSSTPSRLGRSNMVLALENLSAAIDAVLAAPGTLRRAFIAADPQALTIAEMIAALRGGLSRRPNVFALPPALLELALRAARREEIYQRLSGPLIADPAALMSLGWTPRLATPDGLAGLMRASET
jgi:UDP-glucose 4-epimerase